MRFVSLLLLAIVGAESAIMATPVYFAGTGHYYDLVLEQVHWEDARIAASGLVYGDDAGYLATITTAAENQFLDATFNTGNPSQYAWIGGYEPQDDGVWLWGAGPEEGIQFSDQSLPTPPFDYVN